MVILAKGKYPAELLLKWLLLFLLTIVKMCLNLKLALGVHGPAWTSNIISEVHSRRESNSQGEWQCQQLIEEHS